MRVIAFIMRAGVSVGAGLIVGAAATFGLVYSQTQAPSENPAQSEILTYGDQG